MRLRAVAFAALEVDAWTLRGRCVYVVVETKDRLKTNVD